MASISSSTSSSTHASLPRTATPVEASGGNYFSVDEADRSRSSDARERDRGAFAPYRDHPKFGKVNFQDFGRLYMQSQGMDGVDYQHTIHEEWLLLPVHYDEPAPAAAADAAGASGANDGTLVAQDQGIPSPSAPPASLTPHGSDGSRLDSLRMDSRRVPREGQRRRRVRHGHLVEGFDDSAVGDLQATRAT